jgi:hypothetical protein
MGTQTLPLARYDDMGERISIPKRQASGRMDIMQYSCANLEPERKVRRCSMPRSPPTRVSQDYDSARRGSLND